VSGNDDSQLFRHESSMDAEVRSQNGGAPRLDSRSG
jgi:hypothetical protein